MVTIGKQRSVAGQENGTVRVVGATLWSMQKKKPDLHQWLDSCSGPDTQSRYASLLVPLVRDIAADAWSGDERTDGAVAGVTSEVFGGGVLS
eukprot:scaffold223969_cov30-Tisochrysis_lutea.AAC.5